MDSCKLNWKVGFEIELLAPKGASRFDLATKIASSINGANVSPVFHPQAELSLVENAPVFENLTLAYEVSDANGHLIARCADDLTLQDDLVKETPPKPGWYRIVGDDPRFLRLVMRHADAGTPLDQILEPVAELFGGELEFFDNGMVRLADGFGAPIVMAAPLPGERERPCEIITPPISTDHSARLTALLEPAMQLGFTVPNEAALHIHFDASDLCSAKTFSNIVHIFGTYGEQLKLLVGTNPACRRLAGWPDQLQELVFQPGFEGLTWDEARVALLDIHLTKFVDFNVFNIVHARPDKHTFEVRILPVSFDVDEILLAAALFEGLLKYTQTAQLLRDQSPALNLSTLINELPLAKRVKGFWLDICIDKGIEHKENIAVR